MDKVYKLIENIKNNATVKKIAGRLSSKVVWGAILSQILFILMIYSPDTADNFKTVSLVIVEILSLIGILNNPDTRGEY